MTTYLWTQTGVDSLRRWALLPSLGSEWQTATLLFRPSHGQPGSICCTLGRKSNAHDNTPVIAAGETSWQSRWKRGQAKNMPFINKRVSAFESIPSHCWLPPSEGIYTYQMNVYHDMSSNADQGQASIWGILITLAIPSLRTNPLTWAAQFMPTGTNHSSKRHLNTDNTCTYGGIII